VIVPVFVTTLTVFVWLDYRHEVHSLATIQRPALLTSIDEEPAAIRPEPAEDPSVLARQVPGHPFGDSICARSRTGGITGRGGGLDKDVPAPARPSMAVQQFNCEQHCRRSLWDA